ncbi:hypothetical protein ACOSQ3_013462 [Xanthoceras sorbifolium]
MSPAAQITFRSGMWWLFRSSNVTSEAEFDLFVVVVWRIWYRRNRWMHHKVDIPMSGITYWAKNFIVNFQSFVLPYGRGFVSSAIAYPCLRSAR